MLYLHPVTPDDEFPGDTSVPHPVLEVSLRLVHLDAEEQQDERRDDTETKGHCAARWELGQRPVVCQQRMGKTLLTAPLSIEKGYAT